MLTPYADGRLAELSTIEIEAGDREFESLLEWLRAESLLRGHISAGARAREPGTMGAFSTILVDLGTPATVAALTSSLTMWMRQRRSDFKLRLTIPERGELVIDAKRIQDAESLIRQSLSEYGGSLKPGLDSHATDSREG